VTVPTARPIFRELDQTESTAFVAAHHVGRMALAHKDRVEIVPIHYVHDDAWLYCRTAAGTKLELATHNRWVAFEVDEVRALFDWTSVVVKGGVYLLRSDGSKDEAALYDKGVKLIRTLIPESFTPRDPVPERAILFRIHVDEITGRSARPAT
jgi:nitroimidazol reductase NimA-like FMN-containing flavoprotein (pyridoxamine 5'-phosphate oxidase superfamily)